MKNAMISCLFIMHSLGGGGEKVALTLLKELDRARFRPTLACIRHIPQLYAEVPADVRLIMPGTSKFLDFIRTLFTIYQSARKNAIILGTLELQSIFLAALLGKNKVISWIHKDLAPYFARKNNLYVRIYKNVLRFALRRSVKVVCVSEGIAETQRALFPELMEKHIVLYSPLDEKAVLRGSGTELPPSLLHCFSRPVILGVGRLVEQKAFHILIRAHAELLRQGIQHHLCLLGEGTERAFLRREAERLGVSDTVFMPGFLPPYPIMRRALVLAGSAAYEGLGLVIIEAMFLGVPVVYTDCRSGPAELLGADRYGRLTPVGDPHALAEALALMFDPEQRARYARLALERSRDFSFSSAIERWEDTLKSVVAQQTPRASF